MRFARPGARRRRGTTVVEVAFVALICFALMFAIFEYGRYVFMRQVMEHAARTGARVAVVAPVSYVDPVTLDNDLKATVRDALAGQQLANLAITAFQGDSAGNNVGPWTNTPFGKNVVVQIDGDLSLLFPGSGFLPANGAAPNSIHIRVVCMMRSEAN